MVHDPEVGAVVVGSPTPFHAEQIMEAARLGKHIYCEKVALSLQQFFCIVAGNRLCQLCVYALYDTPRARTGRNTNKTR